MRLGNVGVEANGLEVLGDGLLVLLLLLKDEAEPVVGQGVLGVEVDGLAVLGDGRLVLLLVRKDVAEFVVEGGSLGSRSMAARYSAMACSYRFCS
jgi:hypothetical protein